MVYVFEGPRNSGKTFISKYISEVYKIPRYQFAFADYFKTLNIQSQNSKEAHAFALGKELMLMQVSKDLHNVKTSGDDALGIRFSKSDPAIKDFIHDRGILTVLAWGILENRINEDEMDAQVKMIADLNLMDQITIVFIEGNNPDKSPRNKDQWDREDGGNGEMESYLKVVKAFEKYGIAKIWKFKNLFDLESLDRVKAMFDTILFD